MLVPQDSIAVWTPAVTSEQIRGTAHTRRRLARPASPRVGPDQALIAAGACEVGTSPVPPAVIAAIRGAQHHAARVVEDAAYVAAARREEIDPLVTIGKRRDRCRWVGDRLRGQVLNQISEPRGRIVRKSRSGRMGACREQRGGCQYAVTTRDSGHRTPPGERGLLTQGYGRGSSSSNARTLRISTDGSTGFCRNASPGPSLPSRKASSV